MTKLQIEVQEMFKRAHAEADRSHAETVRRHEEIMMLIKKSCHPGRYTGCNERDRGADEVQD